MKTRYRLPVVPEPTFLCDTEVPWVDALRWAVAVMDAGDKSLSFIASCLSYALRGALTAKQAAACGEILTRVVHARLEDSLECQSGKEQADQCPNVIAFKASARQ